MEPRLKVPATRDLLYDTESEGRPLLFIHSINAAPSAIEPSPYFSTSEHPDRICARPPGFRGRAPGGHHDSFGVCKNIASLIDDDPGELPDVIALSCELSPGCGRVWCLG